MSAPRPAVELVLVWHFHQPDYRQPGTGRARLPWVRLHAAKDYLDMARRVESFPGLRITFNFVPVLADQLEDAARDAPDALFDALRRPVGSFDDLERREVAARCLSIPRHALDRWPELLRLVERVGRELKAGALPGDAELAALETGFLLGWLDPLFLAEPEAARVLGAGGFTVQHRDDLLALHARLTAQVLPAYRALAERGQVELSTSPYYHPILPLLVDVSVARRARPDLGLPRERFTAPEDAREQIARAQSRHEELFGRRPLGMWPSEGSVSPEVAEMAAAAGLRWLASDEGVLLRSLPETHRSRSALYRPWALQTPAGEITLFFRDRELSDRIGFVYQQWQPAEAVADFLARLRRIGADHPDGDPPVVSVILDGENCWEGYAEDGGPFLEQLYLALSEAPDIRTRTPAEVVETARVIPILSRLHSGSWIDADFHIWIGHPEKNRAWDLLARARRELVAEVGVEAEVRDALLKAEGSDWFWWLGDDHYTPDKGVFDELFRLQLSAAYAAARRPIPAALGIPVAPPVWKAGLREPAVGFIEPVLDGRATHFYEWQAAGRLHVAGGGAAMHAGPGLASQLYFGFDREHLFVRLDFAAGVPPGAAHGLRLDFVEPAVGRVEVARLAPGTSPVFHVATGGEVGEMEGAACHLETILELSLPRGPLQLVPGQPLEMVVQILDQGRVLETVPPGDAVRVTVPDESFDAEVWSP
jgi:alpha-amylase/alpha-mannosidase (GH57 family)